MKVLTLIITCFLVFSVAAFCSSDDGTDVPDDSLSELMSPEQEKQFTEQIKEIFEESQAAETGSNYTLSCFFSYTSQGVDEVLPEHFFLGPIVSEGLSFSHNAGFRFAAENLTSVEGGGFSNLGDRTVLSFQVWRKFGILNGSVQHRWVHTNYNMDENFFYADRHRTAVRSGFLLGPLQPYVFISSDFPAYTPVDEMAVYGGSGVDLRCRLDRLNTEMYFDVSVAGSLFLYNQGRRAFYRLRAGFATSLLGVTIHPEMLFLRDVFSSEDLWVTSFKIVL